MTRRSLGIGRALAALGAVLALVGCFLPWYTVGGSVLTPVRGNGFEGAGILVFVAAVLTLAVVLLPYVTDDRGPLALDRAATFGALGVLAVVGLVLFVLQRRAALALPDRALGLWIAAAGVALMVWGTGWIARRRSEG